VPKLSVTLITKNEAASIAAAIDSVSWADEIIVIDAESTDDTAAIASNHGASVHIRPWPGYGAQKNYAASIARNDWILSLDADERVTPALAAEIQRLMTSEPEARGYRMPRVAWHLGRWIRTTDWYPNHKLRLYDRRVSRWDETHLVHETLYVEGRIGTLTSELQHFTYRDLSDHLETANRYAELAARELHQRGVRAKVLDLVILPPLTFLRNYVARRGFADGLPGFLISALNAYYVLIKYARLWELERRTRGAGSGVLSDS
jgi:glycosyltransferase involved in cell wall biosynthesis